MDENGDPKMLMSEQVQRQKDRLFGQEMPFELVRKKTRQTLRKDGWRLLLEGSEARKEKDLGTALKAYTKAMTVPDADYQLLFEEPWIELERWLRKTEKLKAAEDVLKRADAALRRAASRLKVDGDFAYKQDSRPPVKVRDVGAARDCYEKAMALVENEREELQNSEPWIVIDRLRRKVTREHEIELAHTEHERAASALLGPKVEALRVRVSDTIQRQRDSAEPCVFQLKLKEYWNTIKKNAKKAMQQGDKALEKEDLHSAYDAYVLGLELPSRNPEQDAWLLMEEPFTTLLVKLRKLERQVEVAENRQDARFKLTARCYQHIERILREGTHRLVKSAYLQLGHDLLISGMVSGIEEGDTDMHFGYCDCCGDELRVFDTTHPAWDELEIETTRRKSNDETWQCNVCEESFLYTDFGVLHGQKMFCCDTIQACDWRACKLCQNKEHESHAQLLTHIVARRTTDEPLTSMMDGEAGDIVKLSDDDPTPSDEKKTKKKFSLSAKKKEKKRAKEAKKAAKRREVDFDSAGFSEETVNPLTPDPSSPQIGSERTSRTVSRESRESLNQSVRGSHLLSADGVESYQAFDVESGFSPTQREVRQSSKAKFNQEFQQLKKGKSKGNRRREGASDMDVFDYDDREEVINPLGADGKRIDRL